MNVRQKLTEPESTSAFIVGGGLALFILGFALASAQSSIPGFDASRLDMVMLVGALLVVGGLAMWIGTSRPWKRFDDWSTPLYTGHHDTAHAPTHAAVPAAVPAGEHAAHAATPDLAALGVEEQVVHHPAKAPIVPEAGGSIKVEDLEGIGPKIASALKSVGINTTADLAFRPPLELERIVRDAGVRMVGHADAWVTQAKLAEEGRWAELEEYQHSLRTRKSR